jgi:hypothetical protein
MKKLIAAVLIAALSSTSVFALQPALVAAPATQELVLPANTEILLSMNSEINSTVNRAGDTFPMTVVSDVRVGDQVLIPRGTRAMGEVTWRTGRGAFGKSGKMDLALRYIDLDGTRLPITGTYRQEGEGSTLATVAGVILVGVFAGFITGSRARVPAGRELAARTAMAVPFVSANGRNSIAPSFGDQLAAWRTSEAGAREATCRASAEAAANRNAGRVARLTRECMERAARQ